MPPKVLSVKEQGQITGERKLIEAYLSTHNLEASINDAINKTLSIKPSDPYKYLATALKDKSPEPRGILQVRARQVFDGRGIPALEVEVKTFRGFFCAIAAPTDSKYTTFKEAELARAAAEKADNEEANTTEEVSVGDKGEIKIDLSSPLYPLELRDGEEDINFGGMAVNHAIKIVSDIVSPALLGKDPTDQKMLDEILIQLDTSVDKTILGINVIHATSMAICKAGAATKEIPLYRHIADLGESGDLLCIPVPVFNVISGGCDGNNKIPFKEFSIFPTGATNYKHALDIGSRALIAIEKTIKAKLGDEAIIKIKSPDCTFSPPTLNDPEEALTLILEALDSVQLRKDIKIYIDVDASKFYEAPKPTIQEEGNEEEEQVGKYNYGWKQPTRDESKVLSKDSLMEKYRSMLEKFPEVVGIEDPFHHEDWETYSSFTEEVGMNMQIISDTLTASSPTLVGESVEAKAVNGVLIRGNQSGTVTEMLQVVSLARTEGWGIVLSSSIHEVDEEFLSDFCVGVKGGLIKLGSLRGGGERMCKYNRLLRIENSLGGDCYFAGDRWRSTG